MEGITIFIRYLEINFSNTSTYHFFSRGNKLIRFNARFYQRILFKYDIRSQNHPDVLFALKTAHHPFPYAFRHARGRIRDTPGNR